MQHNDTLLVLDEFSQIDPRYAGEVAYMLANGQGKVRAAKNGIARERGSWRLLFLSSGEISLSSHMMEAGKRTKAGQEVRMIDIPADAAKGMGIFECLHEFPNANIFADSMRKACAKYHGCAADLFLSKLVLEEKLALPIKLHHVSNQFLADIPEICHGQIKRVAQSFALVAIAGELATSFGVTGWQPGIALTAVKQIFNDWLSQRNDTSTSQENETILEITRHFFQENAARFDVFNNLQQYEKRSIPTKCAGYRDDAGNFYVFPKTFKDEICLGLGSTKDVAKILEKHGWLLTDDKTPYKSVWVPSQGKTIRLYFFSSEVIGEK